MLQVKPDQDLNLDEGHSLGGRLAWESNEQEASLLLSDPCVLERKGLKPQQIIVDEE